MPGMRYRGESWGAWGWVRVSERPEHIAALNERAGDDEVLLPDLDDPATLGCLLALVREAWGDVRIVCEWHARERGDGVQDGWWIVDESGSVLPFTGGHEAEALVAALEAAP